MPPNWYRKKNTIMMIQKRSFEQIFHCSFTGRAFLASPASPEAMDSSVTRSRVKKYSISTPTNVMMMSAMTNTFQWL